MATILKKRIVGLRAKMLDFLVGIANGPNMWASTWKFHGECDGLVQKKIYWQNIR